MHDSEALSWQDVTAKHHSAMVDELKRAIDSERESAVVLAVAAERSKTEQAVAREGEAVRRATTEGLNQNLRRLRQSASQAQIFRLLAEASASFAAAAVVLLLENNQIRLVASSRDEDTFTIDLSDAPAIVSVADTHEPVITLAAESEISAAVARCFSAAPDARLHLFPVNVRQETAAVLMAEGVTLSAPLELLCEAVGMKLEALTQSLPSIGGGLVQIATESAGHAIPASATNEKRAWTELSAEEQRLHLQAQRSARVKVAQMRLDHESELKAATFEGKIYSALQSDIDTARTSFLQEYLSKSPTMVDYLHLELLRSLAHDDERLLGPEYPGPMV